jgi:co-chaperonin GroES (HSP10)
MQTTSIANHHIEPHTSQILVQLHDGRDRDAIVLIPDTAKQQANPFGLVVKVGSQVQDVSVGDKLIFMPNAMLIQITIDGEKFVFVDPKSILGKYIPH